MPTSRVRAAAIGLAAAVAVTACGGGEEAEPGDVPQPTQACAESFAEAEEVLAVSEDADGDGDGTETAAPLDAEGEQAAHEGETARLGLLFPTLAACADARDWLAGARDATNTLPSRLDRRTALGMLCRAAAGDVGDGPAEPPACEALPDESLGDGIDAA